MSSQKNYTWKRVFVILVCLVSLGLFAFMAMHAYYVFQVAQSIHLSFSNSSQELSLFERALTQLILPFAVWLVLQTIFFFWLLRHFFRSTSKAYFAGSARRDSYRDEDDDEDLDDEAPEIAPASDLSEEDEADQDDEIHLSPVQKETANQPSPEDEPVAAPEPKVEVKPQASAWEPVARTIEPEAKPTKPSISFQPQFKEAPEELKEALSSSSSSAVASPLPQVSAMVSETPAEPDISKTQVLAAVQGVAQEISEQSASAVKELTPSLSNDDDEDILEAPKPLSRRERRKRLKEK